MFDSKDIKSEIISNIKLSWLTLGWNIELFHLFYSEKAAHAQPNMEPWLLLMFALFLKEIFLNKINLHLWQGGRNK